MSGRETRQTSSIWQTGNEGRTWNNDTGLRQVVTAQRPLFHPCDPLEKATRSYY